jgi:hypothetical protein
MAVGGQPDVALERVCTVCECLVVRAQGVLGDQVAGTAMRHDLWKHPHVRLRTGHDDSSRSFETSMV